MVCTEGLADGNVARTGCSGNDFCAARFCELDGGQADAACGSVDECPVTLIVGQHFFPLKPVKFQEIPNSRCFLAKNG